MAQVLRGLGKSGLQRLHRRVARVCCGHYKSLTVWKSVVRGTAIGSRVFSEWREILLFEKNDREDTNLWFFCKDDRLNLVRGLTIL